MPEREPQRFVSAVTVYTQAGDVVEDTIEVNRPLKISGWNIYQLSYDETKGRWSESVSLNWCATPGSRLYMPAL